MTLESFNQIATSVWTVWAVLVFTGIVSWALRPANRGRFEQASRIPLDEE
ncbi:MAG: cbb3-type cytochrome oxidase subunit 3 [Reyranella sp.]|jgi:cytochrome c oxidase cbb3-type subunit 4